MPKFKVGDCVHCFRAPSPSAIAFDFKGMVYMSADAGDEYEYWVTNAPMLFPGQPLLIWESEMTKIPCPSPKCEMVLEEMVQRKEDDMKR
jgi:hypothetical protein